MLFAGTLKYATRHMPIIPKSTAGITNETSLSNVHPDTLPEPSDSNEKE